MHNISPKFGINIYKDNKLVDFKIYKICGNYGYMQKEDIELIPPYSIARPFRPSNYDNINYPFMPMINIKGDIEIEAYYNTLDTNQLNYHPCTNKEIKSGLAQSIYNESRPKFKKLAHLDLKSNRVKFYLK
jgi:hypothetical protein